MALPISHGFVLPEKNFTQWLEAVKAYMNAFDRVAVIRSPTGNDLNRFRNISAVQAPGTWHNDDAYEHISRAYPAVVLVDVIAVSTPAELQAALQTRINANDRFGRQIAGGAHIHQRFVLEWPTNARPARIIKTFSNQDGAKYEGVDIYTYPGAEIFAGATGVVGQVMSTTSGIYIDIVTSLEGKNYVTRFHGLKDVAVTPQQTVKPDQRIALAAGNSVKITIQCPGHGLSGFVIPDVIDPTLAIYWQGLRLRPTVRALRVRDRAGTYGEILGTVTPDDAIETQEPHGRTLAKLGIEDAWLRIRRAGVNRAYAAAWYLEAFGIDDPPEAIPGIVIPGMNLDIDHPQGAPAGDPLKPLGWVRLKFNVSYDPRNQSYGNTNVDYTYSRYLPVIQRYVNAGLKVILIFTHQTFGEGQGYVWPQMDTNRWRDLTGKFANIARQIAQKFANSGLIMAYQIWNEQDTDPTHARAAVPIPATDYAYLLGETIKAIRSVDSKTRIITGGHVRGPSEGADYAKRTLAAMPATIRPDGIAFHPYGRGPVDSIFSPFGSIGDAIQAYSLVMPGKPVWITEWGVLDKQLQPELTSQITTYADGFLKIIRTQFPGKVACAVWYAWADGMDNGFGLVFTNGKPKQPLYDFFL